MKPSPPVITLPDDPLATLRAAPPYVLATAERFEQAKANAVRDPGLAAMIDAIRAQATALLDEPPRTHDIPDGKRLLEVSRDVVDRVTILAFTWRMGPEDRWRDRLWAELDAVSRFPDWNPSHFLDTAEMAHAVAIGYDWLHEAWSDAQRKTLRDAMIHHAIEPAFGRYRGGANWSWDVAVNNWNVVCNGGILTAAIAIAADEPDVAREVLRNALTKMPICLQHFAPDGGWPEGPGYWAYTLRYLVASLSTLHAALGTDFGLGDLPGLSQTAGFPCVFTGPAGQTFNYSDGNAGTPKAPPWSRSHVFHYLAHHYQDPRWIVPDLWQDKPHALNVLYHQPTPANPPMPPLDAHYQSVEAVVMRSAWGDPHAFYVATQCGKNTVGHNQADLGTFVFDAAGHRFAEDLGPDDYNLPSFFGEQRYTYYRNRAEGHNIAVIDPDATAGQDVNAGGSVTAFDPDPASPSVTMDLTAGYPAAQSYTRRIGLPDRKALVIEDEIEPKRACDVWWFWHTRATIVVADDGQSALLRRGTAAIRLTLESNPPARFIAMDARPLPTSPDPVGQNPNNGAKLLNNALHHRVKVGDTPRFGEPDPEQAIRKLAVKFENSRGIKLKVVAHVEP